MVAKVRPPTAAEAAKIGNRNIMSIIQPRQNTELMDQLMKQKATVFSMDSLLRTLSRGQAFDVLSSQANVAGYRAVIEAAHHMQRPFAGQMTAAGKIPPAKVLVVGAGVAGLAAIQLAKKKGAIVAGFDVRAAAKEQVESCGARFLEVPVTEDGSGSGGYAKEMSKGIEGYLVICCYPANLYCTLFQSGLMQQRRCCWRSAKLSMSSSPLR